MLWLHSGEPSTTNRCWLFLRPWSIFFSLSSLLQKIRLGRKDNYWCSIDSITCSKYDLLQSTPAGSLKSLVNKRSAVEPFQAKLRVRLAFLFRTGSLKEVSLKLRQSFQGFSYAKSHYKVLFSFFASQMTIQKIPSNPLLNRLMTWMKENEAWKKVCLFHLIFI